MKAFYKSAFFAFLFTLLTLAHFKANAQTTVWLVRHAEKELNVEDPALTKDGKQRVNDLLKKLESSSIAAIWTTDKKRMLQTAEPIARHFKLTPIIYIDFNPIAADILKNYKNKDVLIIGHSNTVIPTIVALGAERPFETLKNDDYDILFKVTINKEGHALIEASYYGNSHHVTQIPGKYLTKN